MAYDITDRELDLVITDLDSAAHGEKSAILSKWARRLSPDPSDPMSTQTLRRRIRQRRGKTKDAPGRPKEIDRQMVLEIAKMKAKGMKAGLGDRELATEIAKEMAERKGLSGASEVSTSSINRILREEIGFRQKKRYRKVEAGFATQVMLMDFSRSKYLQVRGYDSERGDWLLETTGKQLSGKGRERTWYAMLVDDHSRLRLGRLFCDSAESAMMGLAFLRWAWTRPSGADDHPMTHVPRILQTDRGAFRRSKRVQNAFDSLEEVTLRKASKEGQGKVERAFRTLWQRFELPFVVEHGDGYTIHREDVNDLLLEHLMEEAKKQHPRKSSYTCSQVYRGSIMRTPPLELDADIVQLAFDVHTRQVDPYGRVSIDGEKYLCPETVEGIAIEPGMEVRVQLNADREARGRLVDRHHENPFRLEPWEQPAYDDMGGEAAKGTGDTRLQKLRDQIDISTRLEDDLAADGPTVDVSGADADDLFAALGDRSIGVSVESDFASEAGAHEERDYPIPSSQAREYIGRRLQPIGQTYADARDIFDPLLGEVTKDELDTVINEYLAAERDHETA